MSKTCIRLIPNPRQGFKTKARSGSLQLIFGTQPRRYDSLLSGKRIGYFVSLRVRPACPFQAATQPPSLRVFQVNRARFGIKIQRLRALLAHAVARFFGATEGKLILDARGREVHGD